MNLLERINAQGTTVIVITHDREMVKRMKKRTVRMSLGEIISDTIPEEETIAGSTVKTAEPKADTNLHKDTEKPGEAIPEDSFEESLEKSYEEDYEEETFEENDDASMDDFEESLEESFIESEENNWEDDWDEDWTEPETSESQPDSSKPGYYMPELKPNTAEKPRRGLKGSHRPHHRIGKEEA
jgi:cell division transport system ATP-binding protein